MTGEVGSEKIVDVATVVAVLRSAVATTEMTLGRAGLSSEALMIDISQARRRESFGGDSL